MQPGVALPPVAACPPPLRVRARVS